jgi:serine/threonine protein kinase
MQDELDILCQIQPKNGGHPNIVLYAGCNPLKLRLYFEKLEKTSSAVFKELKTHKEVNYFLNHILKDISSALIHLEEHDVVHMDIKQDNVMLRQNGDFVLIDFGRACVLDEDKEVKDRKWVDAPPYGAYSFQSPEVLEILLRHLRKETPVGSKLYFTATHDIYSLGVLLHFYTTGGQMYLNGEPRNSGVQSLATLLNVIQSRKTLEYSNHFDTHHVLRLMLEPKHTERVCAKAVHDVCVKILDKTFTII